MLPPQGITRNEVSIAVGGGRVRGHLIRPAASLAAVICAHPGATRELPQAELGLAETLADVGFATMVIGLATDEEDAMRARLDVPLLAERLIVVTRWMRACGASTQLPLGYLGVGDAAAGALVATAMDPHQVWALVARSSRPERAGLSLMLTRAPTLFIVGEEQTGETVANRVACGLAPHARLEVVPAARDEEDGALRSLSLSAEWFGRWLSPRPTSSLGRA